VAQQILIIGLGQFGMSLARTLAAKGVEVLAVDIDKNRIDEAIGFVAQAVVMNATNENELARLEPGKRDATVCAMGDDSKEAATICTALLRQMGSKLVIARANDKIHQRILYLVGAHQVINPEQEFGKRFAKRLIYKDIIADTLLGDDIHLTEIKVFPYMIGKNLIELSLPKRFGVNVGAIRQGSDGKIVQPFPTVPLQEGDILIIVSSEDAISQLVEGGEYAFSEKDSI